MDEGSNGRRKTAQMFADVLEAELQENLRNAVY